MIKRLLLACTGRPTGDFAGQHAVSLATQHEAKISILPVASGGAPHRPESSFSRPAAALSLTDSIDADSASPATPADEQLEAQLQRIEARCHDAGVHCSRVSAGDRDVLTALGDHWRYHDLLVIGLRSLRTTDLSADEVIVRLIRDGIRPILAVPESRTAARLDGLGRSNAATAQRVLVAYDGSRESAKAMKRFVQLRLYPKASILLATFGKPESEARALLGAAAAYCHAWEISVETAVVPDPPTPGILRFAAQRECELVVVGDGFRNVFARAVLGDTISTIVATAGRPIFLSH